MRPPESFIGQPIRSLQTMLQVIAEADPTHLGPIPDGIYGPQTQAAVSDFQRKHSLPVTGVTDQATWEAVVSLYTPSLVEIQEAQPLNILLNPHQILRRGSQHPHVYLIQAMLVVLSEAYHSVSRPALTGILDAATADSLATFQCLSALPMTGELDKQSWRHLALQYPLAASRAVVSKL